MYSLCAADNFAIKEPVKQYPLRLGSYISMNLFSSFFTVLRFEVLGFRVILLFPSEHIAAH